MQLKNQVVIITGGASGLGKELAKLFLEEQAIVVIGDSNFKALLKTSKEIPVLTFRADVTKENQINNLASFVMKKFKKIDIWINNAGITQPHDSIEKIDLKKGHQIIDTNLFGTIHGSRAALMVMKNQNKGTIINIISINSFIGKSQSAIYTTSKWAVRGFTECLKLAVKGYPIKVIGIHPAGIKTGLFGNSKRNDYKFFLEPRYVAKKIVENLRIKNPKAELIIK